MYVKGTFQEQKSYVALPVFGKVFLRLREAPAVRLLPCTSRPSLWSWFANADTGCEVDSRIWHFFAIFRHMLEFTHFYHPEIPKHADLSSFFLSISTLPQETWWVHSKNHVPARCRSLNSDRIGRNWAKTNGFVWIGGPPKSKMSSHHFSIFPMKLPKRYPENPWTIKEQAPGESTTVTTKVGGVLQKSPPPWSNETRTAPVLPSKYRELSWWLWASVNPEYQIYPEAKNQQICTVGVRIWEIGWTLGASSNHFISLHSLPLLSLSHQIIKWNDVESFGKCPVLGCWPAMIGIARWWNCEAHILGTRAARQCCHGHRFPVFLLGLIGASSLFMIPNQDKHLLLINVSLVFATTLCFRILLGPKWVACHVGDRRSLCFKVILITVIRSAVQIPSRACLL